MAVEPCAQISEIRLGFCCSGFSLSLSLCVYVCLCVNTNKAPTKSVISNKGEYF